MALPFFTVGHSNRPIEDFTALLAQVDVGFVADIRKVPASRANPQFNQGPLSDALRARGVAYEAMAALGGLRGKARGVLSGVNGFWTNDSFHNYADYALSPDFHAALDHLIERGRRQRCAMMCSEAVWCSRTARWRTRHESVSRSGRAPPGDDAVAQPRRAGVPLARCLAPFGAEGGGEGVTVEVGVDLGHHHLVG